MNSVLGDLQPTLCTAALFLAAKVEEQPRKLEHVIKLTHACLHKENPQLDTRSEDYIYKLNEAVSYENILLQTLGFDIGTMHPHIYVVQVCQHVKASKDLAQASYIMATTSLHTTTMCLQYKPTIVACVCIHLACKWSSYTVLLVDCLPHKPSEGLVGFLPLMECFHGLNLEGEVSLVAASSGVGWNRTWEFPVLLDYYDFLFY
ncbi:Cyclin-T1 [Araneus ventricosus]|uniref:Cyclin-T1 n=1 Tax=Araneus ventricosus TaxID=182803 RepID=A0A4Y2J8W3_ARAVE|nr:Cyclin-T1 [Araneus ventricosus]